MIDKNMSDSGQKLTKRQRVKPIAAFTISSVLALGAASWLVLHPMEAKTSEPEERPVTAMTVTDAATRLVDWPVQVGASGTVAPWQEAIVGGQVNGVRLIELHVSPGDIVRRGQVLARFDAEALSADVTQLQASLRQATAQASQAILNRDRALKLRDSGSMSEQDVLQAITLAKTASAQMESAQAQLAVRELQLRYATVVAPDDGVISSRTATIGSVGAVGQELFRRIRKTRLEWRGELTAVQLAEIARGQSVKLLLPDGMSAEAKVRQVAPSINSQTRLGTVYADIVPGSTARSGMYAQGNVVVANKTALTVPAGSIVIRDGRSHVFKLNVLNGTPKASLQAVTVGRRAANDVEIVHGLADGDRVLVQGAGFLNDGDSVRIVQAPAVVTPLTTTKGG
ncbi:Nickel and cobalt resistance protein CnrB [compost metagenome]